MTPKIHVWNATTLEKHTDFSPVPQDNVMRIAIHKDGKYGIAGSDKGHIFAWDTENGKLIKEFDEVYTGEIRDLVFHPSGKIFVTGGFEGNVCLWSMEDSKPIRIITSAVEGDPSCLRFSPDGTALAVTSTWRDQYVAVYDVQNGKRVRNFGGYGSAVRSVNFSPDGRFLITGDIDFWVVIWDIATKEPLWSSPRNAGSHIYRVQMTPDQEMLIVIAGSEPTIYALPEDFAIQK